MKRLFIIFLTALLLCAAVPFATSAATSAEAGLFFEKAHAPGFLPEGFHYTGEVYVSEDGKTFYYFETDPGESGLEVGHWYDEKGNEMPSTFEPFLGQTEFTEANNGAQRRFGAKSAPVAPAFPTSYNAKEHGLVTPVRVQTGGSCWAHSAVGAIEANLIKKGYATANDLTLSEYFLVRMVKDGYFPGADDSANDGYCEADKKMLLLTGGNYKKLGRALLNFSGPVQAEKYDFANAQNREMDALTEELNTKITYTDKYDRDFVVTGIEKIPHTVDSIKDAVLSYGACDFYYYVGGGANVNLYLNSNTNAYYCPDVTSGGHAVTIIGWDDNYSRDNFKDIAKPQSDGAWLVKNSWGEDLINGGFYWISYESRCYSAAVYDTAPKNEYENVYLYDGLGPISTVSASGAANVFTAKSGEMLTKVCCGGVLDPATEYTFEVYKLPADYTSPVDGTLVYTQTSPGSGTKFLDLTTPVSFSQGEIFSVVFRGSAKYGCERSSYSNVVFQSAQRESYYLNSGGRWVDTGNTSRNNMCVRAVTQSVNRPITVTFTGGGSFRDKVTVTDGTVALPTAPAGYTQILTANGMSFTGKGITEDTIVTVHRYPTNGGDGCIKQYKCIYCEREMKPSVGEHAVYSYDLPPTETSFGYNVIACRNCSDYIMIFCTKEPLSEDGFDLTYGSFSTLKLVIKNGDMIVAPYAEGSLRGIRTKTETYSPLVTGTIYINAPASILSQGDLRGYKNAKRISLPYTLTSIEDNALSDLPMLESFCLEDESDHFSVIDGVLYNKDATCLIRYPAGRPDAYFKVPASVSSVAPYAFNGCGNLKYLDLSESRISALPSYALSEMSALEGVNLPDGLKSLSESSIGLESTDLLSLGALYVPTGVSVLDESFFDAYNGSVIYTDVELPEDAAYQTAPAQGHIHAFDTLNCTFSDGSLCGRQVHVCECGRFTVSGGAAHVRGMLKQTAAVSCGSDGYSLYSCAVCGKDFRTDVQPATGSHQWTWITDVPPYCGNSCGMKHETCAVCGKTRNMRTLVPVHPYHEYTTTPDEILQAPTCTEHGRGVDCCVHCGKPYEAFIDPVPHTDNDDNGRCDVCDAEVPRQNTGDICEYCGKTHNGVFGPIIRFFHRILLLFRKLF